MSAASRALAKLAAHEERQAEKARGWNIGIPIYTGPEAYGMAADMARRTALEERWRERIPRFVRRRLLRRSVW